GNLARPLRQLPPRTRAPSRWSRVNQGIPAPDWRAPRRARPYDSGVTPSAPTELPIRLRPWQRLSVRIRALFVAVTLLAVGLGGVVIYERQKRDLEATLGTLLLNIARTGALLVDPRLHTEVEHTLTQNSDAYRRVRAVLAAVQDENRVETPVYTL